MLSAVIRGPPLCRMVFPIWFPSLYFPLSEIKPMLSLFRQTQLRLPEKLISTTTPNMITWIWIFVFGNTGIPMSNINGDFNQSFKHSWLGITLRAIFYSVEVVTHKGSSMDCLCTYFYIAERDSNKNFLQLKLREYQSRKRSQSGVSRPALATSLPPISEDV